MGFEVQFRVLDDLDDADLDAFIDVFLEDAIEANRLAFGGGGRLAWVGFVTLERRGTATEEHRQLVRGWLEGQPQVLEFQVGPLLDAWYPP